MKKKIMAMCLVIAMAATAVIGGTLAYFTDTDDATNEFTIGNVNIELYESQYHRGSPTGPLSITGQPAELKDEAIVEGDEAYHNEYLPSQKLLPMNLNNQTQESWEACAVGKNAYVKNEGSNDAYVRVRYLVPKDVAHYLDIHCVSTQYVSYEDGIYKNNKGEEYTVNNDDNFEPILPVNFKFGANFADNANGIEVMRDNKEYYYCDFIYAEALEPQEMTKYSPISKVYLLPTATQHDIAALNLTNAHFDVLVEVDAIQADGFADAVSAFAAFDNEAEISVYENGTASKVQ